MPLSIGSCFLTTWWIWNSTITGAILAWVLNALLMSITFQLFHFTRRYIKARQSQFTLIFFWISFEFFHHHWDGTWPWLSLGNGFASWHKWIQWYEYTGIFGGTLWIILVNILIYQLINKIIIKENRTRIIIQSSILLLLIVLPVLQSYSLYNGYKEKQWPVDVVVVQPNIDPYNEQYTLFASELLERNLTLARQKADGAVDFFASPESAIQENIWEDRIEEAKSLPDLQKFLSGFPNSSYVIGASTYYLFQPGEKLSATARKFRNSEGHYDVFNSAVFLDSTGQVRLHHKSKLTPGVEKMPFTRLLKPLENLAFDLGGTVGSLGVDAERTVFTRPGDSLKIAPVICYESVFGSYVTQYIRKGANLIFVITNDGWWGNTPGHRQHFTFSQLRAIETRRSIARSANTGISAFIDQRGDVFQVTKYWEPAVIRQEINANDKLTFYVKYGDYIARLSAFTAVLLLLIAISYRLRRKP
ncbi:MAG: apolipoprotein N-acyltransferase [Bacteroidales bacterium]|nr:apolipoprotein N-acyltransferase [Bacteroidales bacterium]